MATLNEDGNVIGRVGAVAVIVLTVWGVQRINSGRLDFCIPGMGKTATLSCCADDASPAGPAAKADAAAPSAKP